MKYYAIRNIKTGEFLSGTDFNYSPPRQIMAAEYAVPKLFTKLELDTEIRRRRINLKKYEVVEVEVAVLGAVDTGIIGAE